MAQKIVGSTPSIKKEGKISNESGLFAEDQAPNQFKKNLRNLQIQQSIKDAFQKVTVHPEYPVWMSMSFDLVRNPVWNYVSQDRMQEITETYRIEGLTPPRIVHEDIFLIRCIDGQSKSYFYNYLSPKWGYLFPFRARKPEDIESQRKNDNAAMLAMHWPIDAKHIDVSPLKDKFAISLKIDQEYGDLVCYIFEFCSVTINERDASDFDSADLLGGSGQRKWIDLGALRADPAANAANGDVIRSIHELFTHDLRLLPLVCKRTDMLRS